MASSKTSELTAELTLGESSAIFGISQKANDLNAPLSCPVLSYLSTITNDTWLCRVLKSESNNYGI